ncbi:MAG: hypothetical protein LBR83_02810 [Clostridiales bacterium]|jgi:hypothetical protein|nr:hypothetical protein [Clostridiales bacterium]
MPANTEIRIEQKRKLFQLLKLNQTTKSKELNNLIIEVKAEMEKEDVAWVTSMVEELEK